jgi:hypothetical protein
VVQKFIPSSQFKNNAPTSDLAADATTNCSIEHSVWNTPFNLMGFPSLGNHPRKNARMLCSRILVLLGTTRWSGYSCSYWTLVKELWHQGELQGN